MIPSHKIPYGQLQSRSQKAEKILSLLGEVQRGDRERILKVVNYIEDYKHKYFKEMEGKILYLRPADTKVAFHLQFCLENKMIFILPKRLVLGKGNSKKVRAAIDYNDMKKVASATIKKSGQEIKSGKYEFLLQKKFGVGIACCEFSRKGRKKLKIIMSYANRRSLEDLVELKTRFSYYKLTASQRKELLEGILFFLRKIHKAGYVYADLKAENVLWDIDREGHVKVMLADFGLSYHFDDKKRSRVCGTPRTVAPEIVDNLLGFDEPISQPVDIFALGFVIWNVFIGGTPPWLNRCARLGPPNHTFLEPNTYDIAWEKYFWPAKTLAYEVHQMMHPEQEKRPRIEQVISRLAGKDPHTLFYRKCGEIRLLSEEEKTLATRLFEQQYGPQKECYTLSYLARKPKIVVVSTFEDEICLPNNKDIVQKYLEKKDLTVCLNFWEFVL